ncbi:MAG: hypothetical protein IJ192_14900 [Clostridia bacterium]|nr:hypothetical protein [Clostridia bacterium]
MQIWKAHYKDQYHDTFVDIVNTEEEYQNDPLSFTLDGIAFRGTSCGDFQLADVTQYDEAKEKFHILKAGGYIVGNRKSPYWYDLQRYALDIDIPVKVFRKRDNSEIQGTIHISFEYTVPDTEKSRTIIYCDDVRVYRDDVNVYDFTLYVDGVNYSSTRKTLYFESALHDICKQMSRDYYIKCCFTCQYSDYSPYGCDDYGTMLCYRKYKGDCLKVNNKDDFFKYLEDKDFEMRQETYLCKEYELRNKCPGYRGFVDGDYEI